MLTHDFVNRVHMEIFNMQYYPPELKDWWMDDWISRVYGHRRVLKASDVQVGDRFRDVLCMDGLIDGCMDRCVYVIIFLL